MAGSKMARSVNRGVNAKTFDDNLVIAEHLELFDSGRDVKLPNMPRIKFAYPTFHQSSAINVKAIKPA